MNSELRNKQNPVLHAAIANEDDQSGLFDWLEKRKVDYILLTGKEEVQSPQTRFMAGDTVHFTIVFENNFKQELLLKYNRGLIKSTALRIYGIKTLSFPLKLEYLENPIKIGYRLKTFSGNPRKVIVYFDFYDESKKLLSRLTYVLSGGKDHYNYSNQTVSGVNYITFMRNYNNVGEEQPVVFENILKEHNAGARRINARILEPKDITSVVVNLQTWYDSGGGRGDVSVSFYSWDKYVIAWKY